MEKKKINMIEIDARKNKALKADKAASFFSMSQSRSKVIAASRKKREQDIEVRRRKRRRMTGEGSELREGQQPTGQHCVDSGGPCHWARTEKDKWGHICVDAARRVRATLWEVTCQKRGLLGTGARAAPQEAGTKTVAEEYWEAAEQRVRGKKCRQKDVKEKVGFLSNTSNSI